MTFVTSYLDQAQEILKRLDPQAIEAVALILRTTRSSGGRLFIIGSGGGAGHASHATCDFRKLCGIETYCPTDNISELTARINDEGWDVCIGNYLQGSHINSRDCVLIFSVGGGSIEKNISPNLVHAIRVAKSYGARVVGIVGRDGGYTAAHADACIVVPTVDSSLITPHTESFQALLWHLLVSHPELQRGKTKWESVSAADQAAESNGHANGHAIVSSVTRVNGSDERNGNGHVSEMNAATTQILKIKIFADGAEKAGMLEMYRNPMISGFTTNPTLMKKAGIRDYREFALDILNHIPDRPISFEVFSDDFQQMEREANEIASWGDNVYIKIPITNTKGASSVALIERLSRAGAKVNVTALMTLEQVREVGPALLEGPASYVSVFAGRVADTGRDPLPLMRQVINYLRAFPKTECIWASPRELLNIFQADQVGCHIITATNDILKKLTLTGKNLSEFSLETVKMFYDDARAAGFSLEDSGSEPAVQVQTIQ